MKIVVVACAACALLATPAMAQSIGEKTGINAMVGASPSTADFVTQAAVSDMFEIESSKLATERADAQSKTFAQRMITDHTETSKELKSLVESGKVQASLPTALDSSHQSKLDKLRSLQGADFDKQYDSDQVSAHKDAVSLFERYANGGDNAALKAFAGKYLPHLQEHLRMAESLGTGSPAPTVGQGSQ